MTLLTEWERLRGQLGREDEALLKRLIDAYGGSYARITPLINSLIENLESQLQSGALKRSEVSRSAAFNALLDAIDRELNDYEGYLKTELRTASDSAARAGLAAGTFLIIAALADAFGVPVNEIPRDTIARAPEDALDFLADYIDRLSPCVDRMSGVYSSYIKQTILDGVAQGMNPKTIANMIADSYGLALTDSMRMMRTAQLYSYRQANRLAQIANEDILDGVVWTAKLDSLTCMSCVELHGKVFPVGTLCNDHHNGRCVMLPLVKGADNPLAQNGEDWFNEQNETTQRAMLGNARYDAWKAGKFNLADITGTYQNDVFGEMRREVPLKELVNE